jgi:hypothetical protein
MLKDAVEILEYLAQKGFEPSLRRHAMAQYDAIVASGFPDGSYMVQFPVQPGVAKGAAIVHVTGTQYRIIVAPYMTGQHAWDARASLDAFTRAMDFVAHMRLTELS